jgi:hypothetical protein
LVDAHELDAREHDTSGFVVVVATRVPWGRRIGARDGLEELAQGFVRRSAVSVGAHGSSS